MKENCKENLEQSKRKSNKSLDKKMKIAPKYILPSRTLSETLYTRSRIEAS